jgi:hypothetical protein
VRATKGNNEKGGKTKNSKELKRNMMPRIIRKYPYQLSRTNCNFKGGKRGNSRV